MNVTFCSKQWTSHNRVVCVRKELEYLTVRGPRSQFPVPGHMAHFSFKIHNRNLLSWKLHDDKMHDALCQSLSCKLLNSNLVSFKLHDSILLLLSRKLHGRKFFSGKLHERVCSLANRRMGS